MIIIDNTKTTITENTQFIRSGMFGKLAKNTSVPKETEHTTKSIILAIIGAFFSDIFLTPFLIESVLSLPHNMVLVNMLSKIDKYKDLV